MGEEWEALRSGEQAKMPEVVCAELHAHLKDSDVIHADLKAHDKMMEGKVDFISDMLFGEQIADIDGNLLREGGSLDKLDALYNAQQNDGIKAKLSASTLALVTALYE